MSQSGPEPREFLFPALFGYLHFHCPIALSENVLRAMRELIAGYFLEIMPDSQTFFEGMLGKLNLNQQLEIQTFISNHLYDINTHIAAFNRHRQEANAQSPSGSVPQIVPYFTVIDATLEQTRFIVKLFKESVRNEINTNSPKDINAINQYVNDNLLKVNMALSENRLPPIKKKIRLSKDLSAKQWEIVLNLFFEYHAPLIDLHTNYHRVHIWQLFLRLTTEYFQAPLSTLNANQLEIKIYRALIGAMSIVAGYQEDEFELDEMLPIVKQAWPQYPITMHTLKSIQADCLKQLDWRIGDKLIFEDIPADKISDKHLEKALSERILDVYAYGMESGRYLFNKTLSASELSETKCLLRKFTHDQYRILTQKANLPNSNLSNDPANDIKSSDNTPPATKKLKKSCN